MKFTGTESRTEVSRGGGGDGGGGGGNDELFNGYRLSVLQDKRSPGDCNVMNTTN